MARTYRTHHQCQMAGDALRMAVIGGGRMGRVHIRALARAPSVRVTALVEPVAAIRDMLAAPGLAAVATVDELVRAGVADAALIAAPTDLHRPLVAQLTGAGLPVLCEKPCGLTPGDASAAGDAAAAAGVALQIGYWRRFVPELIALRERIAGGDLGELLRIACAQWDERPPEPGFRARSGGIAIDMGVHEFDQVRWLTGQEFLEVEAMPATIASAPLLDGDPESAEVCAELSGGTLADVSLGRRFPRPDSCWLEAMGTGGHVRCDYMWGAEGQHVFDDAVAAQAEAFAATVRGAPQAGADAGDAVAALDVAERALATLDARLAARGATA